jgi:hypothetical protein
MQTTPPSAGSASPGRHRRARQSRARGHRAVPDARTGRRALRDARSLRGGHVPREHLPRDGRQGRSAGQHALRRGSRGRQAHADPEGRRRVAARAAASGGARAAPGPGAGARRGARGHERRPDARRRQGARAARASRCQGHREDRRPGRTRRPRGAPRSRADGPLHHQARTGDDGRRDHRPHRVPLPRRHLARGLHRVDLPPGHRHQQPVGRPLDGRRGRGAQLEGAARLGQRGLQAHGLARSRRCAA